MKNIFRSVCLSVLLLVAGLCLNAVQAHEDEPTDQVPKDCTAGIFKTTSSHYPVYHKNCQFQSVRTWKNGQEIVVDMDPEGDWISYIDKEAVDANGLNFVMENGQWVKIPGVQELASGTCVSLNPVAEGPATFLNLKTVCEVDASQPGRLKHNLKFRTNFRN